MEVNEQHSEHADATHYAVTIGFILSIQSFCAWSCHGFVYGPCDQSGEQWMSQEQKPFLS